MPTKRKYEKGSQLSINFFNEIYQKKKILILKGSHLVIKCSHQVHIHNKSFKCLKKKNSFNLNNLIRL